MIYRIILEGVRPKAEVDNTLLDLHNSSYPTQPHSLIVKYSIIMRFHTAGKCTFQVPVSFLFTHIDSPIVSLYLSSS